jgi:hypothetical protein
MGRLDELHLDHPFAGRRMLRDAESRGLFHRAAASDIRGKKNVAYRN